MNERAYAIIRSDDFLGDDAPSEEKITVKLIVWSREEAMREVDRLNALGKRARYFWQATRVEAAQVAAPAAESSSGPQSIVSRSLTIIPSRQGRRPVVGWGNTWLDAAVADALSAPVAPVSI